MTDGSGLIGSGFSGEALFYSGSINREERLHDDGRYSQRVSIDFEIDYVSFSSQALALGGEDCDCEDRGRGGDRRFGPPPHAAELEGPGGLGGPGLFGPPSPEEDPFNLIGSDIVGSILEEVTGGELSDEQFTRLFELFVSEPDDEEAEEVVGGLIKELLSEQRGGDEVSDEEVDRIIDDIRPRVEEELDDLGLFLDADRVASGIEFATGKQFTDEQFGLLLEFLGSGEQDEEQIDGLLAQLFEELGALSKEDDEDEADEEERIDHRHQGGHPGFAGGSFSAFSLQVSIGGVLDNVA